MADTTTTQLGLTKPGLAAGDVWGGKINTDLDLLDATFDPATGHDHSGATGHGPVLAQANTHGSPDTDSSPTALHHTIGSGANQAAAGNHQHETFGIVFTGSGDVALKGDGSIATKRY